MKIVITGGPSCGKTSIIEDLKQRGYCTLDEIARKVIKEKRLDGKSLNDREFMDLEQEIYGRSINQERVCDTDPNKIYFFDRGIVDIHGYCNMRYGYVSNEFKQIPVKKYDLVFILERLPFVADGERLEKTDDEATTIHNAIIEAYRQLEYAPITVPIIENKNISLAISKRTDYILERIRTV